MAERGIAPKDTSEKLRLARKNEYGAVKKKDHYTGQITYEIIDKEDDDVSPLVKLLNEEGYYDAFDENGNPITNTSDNSDDVEAYINKSKRKELSVREKALHKIVVSFVNKPQVKEKLSKEWFIKRAEVDAVAKWVTKNYVYEHEEVVEAVKQLFS